MVEGTEFSTASLSSSWSIKIPDVTSAGFKEATSAVIKRNVFIPDSWARFRNQSLDQVGLVVSVAEVLPEDGKEGTKTMTFQIVKMRLTIRLAFAATADQQGRRTVLEM